MSIFKILLHSRTQISTTLVHWTLRFISKKLILMHYYIGAFTFRGIVKCQLLRFQRICSRKENSWEATKTLFSTLRSRDSSQSFLQKILKSFQEIKVRDDKEIIPFSPTYSKIGVEINTKVKQNFNMINKNSPVLGNYKISAFQRNQNLGDLLVHSKLKPPSEFKGTLCCLEYKYKKWVSNKTTKETFAIHPNLNPRSKNCVHLIYCGVARCIHYC